ncbi:hypothetical protein ACMT1E_04275 [Sphingomonas flavalba]|uniref:hypothetical protein n=1 Tax=Sphingomonas flavalba TaxID=2559804 RepID=UPI0039E0F78C
MTIPGWPPKDLRALLALVASIAGAAVLTGFAAWLVWILWRGGWPVATAPMRVAALARALMLALLIIGAVLLSLGLAINRRSIRLGRDGFEASGGDDAPPVARVTTETTVVAPPPMEPGRADQRQI